MTMYHALARRMHAYGMRHRVHRRNMQICFGYTTWADNAAQPPAAGAHGDVACASWHTSKEKPTHGVTACYTWTPYIVGQEAESLRNATHTWAVTLSQLAWRS